MSCIFTLTGKDFDPDSFRDISQLIPDKITYKGTPKFSTKPDSELMPYSVFRIIASEASFDHFHKQISDVKAFLESNYEKLLFIKQDETIEYATLSFGVDYKNTFVNTYYLPVEITSLAGNLGIGIEVCVYTSE